MFTSCGTLAVMACYAVPLWICHLLRTLCGVNGVGLLGGGGFIEGVEGGGFIVCSFRPAGCSCFYRANILKV